MFQQRMQGQISPATGMQGHTYVHGIIQIFSFVHVVKRLSIRLHGRSNIQSLCGSMILQESAAASSTSGSSPFWKDSASSIWKISLSAQSQQNSQQSSRAHGRARLVAVLGLLLGASSRLHQSAERQVSLTRYVCIQTVHMHASRNW